MTVGSPREAAPTLSVPIRNFADTPPADWRQVLDQVRAAEDAGIDRVFVHDHVAFGPDLSAYGDPKAGGRSGGVQPTGPDGDWLDPLTVLAAMAAVTSRIRLATNVLVAGLRRPVVLAKVATTLDALSHGRFELGVGIGWQEAEFAAVGVDFTERGRVLDETLAVCRELWTARTAAFDGRYTSFGELHMMPKPVDPAGVAVWIGGSAIPATARRVTEYGTGWIPWGVTADNLAERIGTMRALVERAGGDFGAVHVAGNLRPTMTSAGDLDLDRLVEPVPEMRRLGITDFRAMVNVPADYRSAHELLAPLRERFALAVS